MEKSIKRSSGEDAEQPKKSLKVLNMKARQDKGKKEMKINSLQCLLPTPQDVKMSEGTSSSKETSPLIAQVARQACISYKLCETIINCFDEDCTIPFLVRYRNSKIGGKTAEELRLIKDIHNTMKQIQKRASSIKKILTSKKVLSDDLQYHIDNAQTMMELEDLYQPFKSSKKTRIQQAEDIGLVDKVKLVLENRSTLERPEDIVNPKLELLKNRKTVEELLAHISGDLILKDLELISKLPTMYNMNHVYIVTQKNTRKGKETSKKKTSPNDKFQKYYDFRRSYVAIKPHEVLAINRGEEQHELKVIVELPNSLNNQLHYFLWNKWVKRIKKNTFMFEVLNSAIETEVKVKLEKKITKRIRADLTAIAEKESLQVFSSNLKWLLLTRPVYNHIVLAIDPGFTGGCKIAVVSHDQKVLGTSLLYLNNNNHQFVSQLTALIKIHNVSLIAIGNGKGCREVEKCVGELIKNLMKNGTDIHYTIVSEQGVSIYSCSDEAKTEYPELSPMLISAVSLAKRVIDPLGEMIKVKPKHLGVGMYQHDLNSKRLDEMLNEVVSEVVSMVGVNLNSSPLALLMQVAGLTESRAKALISFRETNGPFKQRSEIIKIKGIGKKTYEQCAGFVRILPQGEDGDIAEPLDQTIIHPEDYAIATRFIKEVCVLNKQDIGKDCFIQGVQRATELGGKLNICKQLKIDECTFDVLYEGLTKSLHYDLRMDCEEQLFKKEITSFEQLRINQTMTGRVENVTHFGSFIDIGVENSMLLPANSQNRQVKLHYGQKVLVKVMEINSNAQKVTLSLVDVLSK